MSKYTKKMELQLQTIALRWDVSGYLSALLILQVTVILVKHMAINSRLVNGRPPSLSTV